MTAHTDFEGMARAAAAMNAEDTMALYACEPANEFAARTKGHRDLVGECLKREYAKASPGVRALWDMNPFDDRNGNPRDGIDRHAAGCTHDDAGLRIL